MGKPETPQPRPDAALIAALEAAHIHPLWDRYQRITPVAPRANDAPFHWRWRELEPYVQRAAREVAIADVERRALILAHPAFGGATQTTSNLLAAFTVLEPGDRAVPHRHTAAAIRFSTRARGAVTIVNGRRCEMQDGDLVLTPPYCWHGHINESDHRTVWYDAANMPLICGMDANFFEPGSRDAQEFWKVGDAGSELYRYPGEQMRAALAAAGPAADGVTWLRYRHRETGGAVMPTLDCYAARLPEAAPSRPRRTSWNAVCLVVRGEGRSMIGEKTFEWSREDVFTIPHWTFAQHEARGGDAELFVVTDRAVYERLELEREELQ